MIVTEIVTKKYKDPSGEQLAKAKEMMAKMRKEGEKMQKGIFEFIDAQGGWFDFNYRFFPGDPITKIKIIHGEIVDLPMIVVKHLNNCYKKVRVPSPERDEQGRPLKAATVTKISRTRFIPVDMQ